MQFMLHVYYLLVFSHRCSSGRNQSPSQVTGMALVRCILGKFLGVVCFPPCYMYIELLLIYNIFINNLQEFISISLMCVPC
jgi:hypothetical protein